MASSCVHMKKFLLVSVWLPTTFFTLLLCLFYLHTAYPSQAYLRTQLHLQAERITDEKSEQYQLYTALPAVLGTAKTTFATQDARPALLERFLKKYKSPLLPHAQYIVDIADKYGLDYALIPAMAMQESNLCLKIPEGSHNCWGYGIYGSKIVRFASFEEGIGRVAATLRDKYIQDSLTNPNLIMSRWTPSSDGSWADSVNIFMQEIHQGK